MAQLWIGTSGWIYQHWQGIFYPPDLPARDHLAFYATHFPTVEVNYSFTGQAGTGFGEAELAAWARQIGAFQAQGADAYVYFNNDPEGHALHDAARLRALLAS